MFLVYSDGAEELVPGTPQWEAALSACAEFDGEAEARGASRAGGPLRPPGTARTVRKRGGEVLVTDGPFAETKEQLAGYVLVDCKDLDDALYLATRFAAGHGAIEVRPVFGPA